MPIKTIDARTLATLLITSSENDPFEPPSETDPNICLLVQAFELTFSDAMDLYIEVQAQVLKDIEG